MKSGRNFDAVAAASAGPAAARGQASEHFAETTSPFQSDKKLDLSEVQEAMSNLAKFVESAPSDVPPATVDNLRTLSTYKIDPAMPPQEVHQAIFKLASSIRP